MTARRILTGVVAGQAETLEDRPRPIWSRAPRADLTPKAGRQVDLSNLPDIHRTARIRVVRHLPWGQAAARRILMTKYVFDFTEGDKDQKALLGGKVRTWPR